MTTLPKPGAVLPALPDRTRLLDVFLAKRNPRTLAACQADLEDFRRFIEANSVYAPTIGKAVEWLLGDLGGLANALVSDYRWEMSKRELPVTTINRRLAMLRSLIKLANTLGLVSWTLWVKNAPAQPYPDTDGPGRDGFRAMLDAAGAQPGPKGLRDVALLRLLHDLGLRRSEAVRLDVRDVDLPRNWIFIPGRSISSMSSRTASLRRKPRSRSRRSSATSRSPFGPGCAPAASSIARNPSRPGPRVLR